MPMCESESRLDSLMRLMQWSNNVTSRPVILSVEAVQPEMSSFITWPNETSTDECRVWCGAVQGEGHDTMAST